MTPLLHLVARAHRSSIDVTDHDVAAWLWAAFRTRYPHALAAVLMPDQLHLLVRGEPEQARRLLVGIVGGLRRSRRRGAALRWDRVPTPTIVPNAEHANRLVRNLHLNPCRDGLTDDPLAWPWSTHRDLVGAIADPWGDIDQLARELQRPRADLRRSVHRFICGHPTVSAAAAAFPMPRAIHPTLTTPLSYIASAVASATRTTPDDIRRRGPTRDHFLALALRDGWAANQLALACNMKARAVRYRLAGLAQRRAPAAELCLATERLRTWRVAHATGR